MRPNGRNRNNSLSDNYDDYFNSWDNTVDVAGKNSAASDMHREKLRLLRVIGVSTAVIAVLLLVIVGQSIYLNLRSDDHETPAQQVQIPDISQPSAAIVPETTLPGTDLQNVELYPDGRVKSGYEYIEGKKVEWIYCYDENDIFMYRMRMIDEIDLSWSGEYMPNSTMNYQILDSALDNCLGFTFVFNITNVPSGTGRGDRTLHIMTEDGNWIEVEKFAYDTYDPVEIVVSFDAPMSLAAIGTLKVERSSKNVYKATGRLVNVWVVEYVY